MNPDKSPQSRESRIYRPQLPVRLIVGAVLIGVLIMGFIVFAVVYTGRPIQKALMAGTVVGKEFIPSQREEQITIGAGGTVSARTVEGEFILTVEVPGEDGSKEQFKVWMPNRESYDAVKVGDPFNVGPYLQK
ncbi:MAG: hypothetical protein Fur0032_22850 [Terrimicrobiaceae bacterium]